MYQEIEDSLRSALNGGPMPRSEAPVALAQRTDIVREGRRLALAGPPINRHDAMVADLALVRGALERVSIDYLLVRGDDDRPIIAVDRSRRQELERQLASEFAAEPFYARLDGDKRSERLLALGRLPGDEEDELFLLYRRRTRSSRAAWRIGEAAVRLELWSFSETEILAPRPNALTRRRIDRRDAVMTTVDRDGYAWPTFAGMFDDHVDDVDFPIDIVFSWVDGSDPEYLAERSRYLAQHQLNPADAGATRYRQIDELKYALRSVKAFAPWVRRIFIATDSKPPAWLDTEHPDVTVVRSEEFFADTSVLPTYNSHAVESQLHRIPGLSEHFLYSNDDMFFGRPVSPSMFFSPGGITRFVEATVRIGLGDTHPDRTGHDNAMRVNRALLRKRFGRTITRHLEHCAVPMRRSVMRELETAFPQDFARTAASRFRSPTDISVTNSLYPYYALLTGRALQQPDARVRYVETTLASTPSALNGLRRGRRFDMFCLNDGSEPELDESTRVELVTSFLDRYFPVPGPWERQLEASTATTA
ncbi:stealth family protein [Ruicaihuangia caeni]|uniref:Stealth family protein n=1 Tax=Ruicaihuangia caeni TaxID=3042517 RepID=A0AAW6T3E5_9MICO|nr:stealth family protein [Klugiella sp. YN-L-19]MDI2097964.1 stealth family protein [Klugiella sp. YN-L-19]